MPTVRGCVARREKERKGRKENARRGRENVREK